MHCVIYSFSKLVPNLTPYILTQCEYNNNTCHAESYDIHIKLCEAGGQPQNSVEHGINIAI